MTNLQYPPDPVSTEAKTYSPGDRVRIRSGLEVDPGQSFAGKVGTVTPKSDFLTKVLGAVWVDLEEPVEGHHDLILFPNEVEPV